MDWEQVRKMYEAVSSGISSRADKVINGYKVTIYSMGATNPTIRIDIKALQ